jgi:phosphohistidine phosphatase
LNIFLIRHTKAESTTHVKKDRERELTDEGIKVLRKSVTTWKNFVNDFDFILSSPFKRAVHTAEIIAECYNYKDEIIKDSSLAPGSTVNAIIQLAASLKGERLAFIGHQPDIGFQISSLISNSEVNLKISPASIISLSFDGNPKVGKGILKFLLPPVNL